jgi:hypothetical protein
MTILLDVQELLFVPPLARGRVPLTSDVKPIDADEVKPKPTPADFTNPLLKLLPIAIVPAPVIGTPLTVKPLGTVAFTLVTEPVDVLTCEKADSIIPTTSSHCADDSGFVCPDLRGRVILIAMLQI